MLQPIRLEADLGGEFGAPGPDLFTPWMETKPLLPSTVHIPGALHVLDNLQKDLQSVLKHYSKHLQELKLLQPLLGETDYRQRTCLRGLAWWK